MQVLKSIRQLKTVHRRRVIVHTDDTWLAEIAAGEHEFFTALDPHLKRNDVETFLVPAESRVAKRVWDDPKAFHLLVDRPPLYGPKVLHVNPGPVLGFWHMDELGSGWNSSLRLSEFDPETVDIERAEYFFNGVSGYMIRENVSLLPQTERVHNGLLKAAATVFCQPEADPSALPAYLPTEDIVRATAEHNRDGLIYVKLHPNQSKDSRRAIMDVCSDYQSVNLSEASIHDLIDASSVVVTQNSRVGFEALMHKRPVITCAKSCYWHATLTARTRTDLKQALTYSAEAMEGFPYEKYFFWTLVRHGFEPAKDIFGKRAWARIREKAMW